MSDWFPIEEYDKLKNKPKYCIFWVEEMITDRFNLSPCLSIERNLGSRKTTHYIQIEPPGDNFKKRSEALNEISRISQEMDVY